MSHFVVSGAAGGSTQGAAAPNRLEINVFVKNDRYFSLYIQALRAPVTLLFVQHRLTDSV